MVNDILLYSHFYKNSFEVASNKCPIITPPRPTCCSLWTHVSTCEEITSEKSSRTSKHGHVLKLTACIGLLGYTRLHAWLARSVTWFVSDTRVYIACTYVVDMGGKGRKVHPNAITHNQSVDGHNNVTNVRVPSPLVNVLKRANETLYGPNFGQTQVSMHLRPRL